MTIDDRQIRTQLECKLLDSITKFQMVAQFDGLKHPRLRGYLAEHLLNDLAPELVELTAKLEIAERQARDLDRTLSDTIRERDFADDMADKLAYAVAPVEDIGEHSSENCPWQNALDLVTPVAEVDRLRKEVADLEVGLGLNEAA